MRFSTGTFDTVHPKAPVTSLPVRLTLAPDRGRTITRLLLLAPPLALLAVPAAMAVMVLASADLQAARDGEQVSVLALVLHPLLWLACAGLAWQSVRHRLGRRRHVLLTADHVCVADAGPTGLVSWRAPLSDFSGIAHNIRASLCGVAHELILVHPDPSRSLLLRTAGAIPQEALDHYCALLRVVVVPAREVYRLNWPRLPLAAPIARGLRALVPAAGVREARA